MDDGRSERITVVENVSTTPSQHAITEYRVLDSSIHGLLLCYICICKIYSTVYAPYYTSLWFGNFQRKR